MLHMGSRTFGFGGVTGVASEGSVTSVTGESFTCALCANKVVWGTRLTLKKDELPDDAIDVCDFCASHMTGVCTYYYVR